MSLEEEERCLILDTRMCEPEDTCTGGGWRGTLRTITLASFNSLESKHLVGTRVLWKAQVSSLSVLSRQSHQQSHTNGSILTTEQGPIHPPD